MEVKLSWCCDHDANSGSVPFLSAQLWFRVASCTFQGCLWSPGSQLPVWQQYSPAYPFYLLKSHLHGCSLSAPQPPVTSQASAQLLTINFEWIRLKRTLERKLNMISETSKNYVSTMYSVFSSTNKTFLLNRHELDVIFIIFSFHFFLVRSVQIVNHYNQKGTATFMTFWFQRAVGGDFSS